MPSSSTHDVLLVRYPFSDLSDVKIRPAVVVHAPHSSMDLIIVPLTSRTSALLEGKFTLREWGEAGLNVPTAVKRGIYTVHPRLVVKSIGRLAAIDAEQMGESLRLWLGL